MNFTAYGPGLLDKELDSMIMFYPDKEEGKYVLEFYSEFSFRFRIKNQFLFFYQLAENGCLPEWLSLFLDEKFHECAY